MTAGMVLAASVAWRAAGQTVTVTPQEPDRDRAGAAATIATSRVRVSEHGAVDIVVQNDDVVNVLQKLAIQARRNIVSSPGVRRTVNAAIHGVPLEEALDGLLRPNGLGYVERGGFIHVYTAGELAALRRDRRTSRVIRLDYLAAADARNVALPLLSPDGAVEAARGDGGGGAIVVNDHAEHVAAVEALVRQLDAPPAQVLLEATILQTALTEENAFGVDFALLSDVGLADFFGLPPGPPGTDFMVSSPGNAAHGDATLRAGITSGDVGIFIRALDRVTDVSLLSNPKVLALDRRSARVHVGKRVGYLETAIAEDQVVQTVKFIDTGIQLDVRPFVLRDGRVRLELAPELSDVTFREVAGVDGLRQEIPDEDVQTVRTDVVVPAGYTAVIGGLFVEDTTRRRSQVPVLGDLPVIGPAFRGQDDSLEHVEIIFLIRPTVLGDAAIVEQGERAERARDHVRTGARLGLLPWSRERRSLRLNLAAEQRARAGDVAGALWNVRRSLELHPDQPELRAWRERLVTDAWRWPSRSLLERILEQDVASMFDAGPVPPERLEPYREFLDLLDPGGGGP